MSDSLVHGQAGTANSPVADADEQAALLGEIESPQSESPKEPPFDWLGLIRHPNFIAAAIMTVALVFAFLPLFKTVPGLWFEADSLYSHGPLIPLMSAWILWERWPKIKDTPVKGSWIPLIGLIPILYVTWIASRTSMQQTLSVLFIASAMLCVWFVAGWRWMVATAGSIVFLLFSLKIWDSLVDRYTQPLQKLSTDMSISLLNMIGASTYRSDSTTIVMDRFVLNVGAPCSGAKLTLSLVAFAAFFVLSGNGRWWSNVALLLILLPFSLLVNGLRIAMIGLVGNSFGAEVGHQFHDYGGYISLVICFILLRMITRLLGFR